MPRSAPRLRSRLAACLLWLIAESALGAGWSEALSAELERIDRASPGTLGVYVKRLDSGETLSYGADRFWYLGSTVKVPIAIAVLQQVDAGTVRLDDRMTLAETDRTEAGPTVWNRVGTVFTVDELLKRMLGFSDNTAANMLIRRIGADRFNASAKAAMGEAGVHELTTLAQVRFDVYSELHPNARLLSNDQVVRIAAAPLGPQRVEAVRRALDQPASALTVQTIGEAYDRYYAAGRNQATLEAYGAMLEKLVEGKLLSPRSTARLFTDMKIGTYTNYRVQAGLPRSVTFIHKTGTQYLRACHSGVIAPENGGVQGVVVAVCAADIDEQQEAGRVFEQVGRAITQTVLGVAPPPR